MPTRFTYHLSPRDETEHRPMLGGTTTVDRGQTEAMARTHPRGTTLPRRFLGAACPCAATGDRLVAEDLRHSGSASSSQPPMRGYHGTLCARLIPRSRANMHCFASGFNHHYSALVVGVGRSQEVTGLQLTCI